MPYKSSTIQCTQQANSTRKRLYHAYRGIGLTWENWHPNCNKTPFSEETTLRNIITGIIADKNVNVQDLFTVGASIVTEMNGVSVFDYSYKRKSKVRTLAYARGVKVSEERTIDPVLLFQRFLVVSQSGELCPEDVIKYELSPYPPSLFEGRYVLRKPEKAQLQEAIQNHVKSSDAAVLQSIPKTDHYVLDGGSLLHRLKWREGSKYSSIADSYASFTSNLYGKANVVFDGYTTGRPNTKDNTHVRRRSNVTNNVNIREAIHLLGKCKNSFQMTQINRPSSTSSPSACNRQAQG